MLSVLWSTLLLSLLTAPAVLAQTVQLTLLNGETIQSELIPAESNDDVKVLIHPRLGRLVVSEDDLKPVEKHHPGTQPFPQASTQATNMGMEYSRQISMAAAVTRAIATSSNSKLA